MTQSSASLLCATTAGRKRSSSALPFQFKRTTASFMIRWNMRGVPVKNDRFFDDSQVGSKCVVARW